MGIERTPGIAGVLQRIQEIQRRFAPPQTGKSDLLRQVGQTGPAGQTDHIRQDALAAQSPAGSEKPDTSQFLALLNRYAATYGVDPALAEAVAQAESGLNPAALSEKGAVGIMQLMPSTAQELGVDPADPVENIEGGVRYLASMLQRYQGDVPLAVAAYNAGPGAVDRTGGMPPYPETHLYVRRVLEAYEQAAGRPKTSEGGLPEQQPGAQTDD